MIGWLELKYVHLLSSQLPLFKERGRNLWVFRCPICGDSEKSRFKARGYIYEKSGDLVFHCHNCSVHLRFKNLLRRVDPVLYDEYMVETLVESGRRAPRREEISEDTTDSPQFSRSTFIDSLERVSELFDGHPARTYVESRHLPDPSRFYYAPRFAEWARTFSPEKFSEEQFPPSRDEPRLVIPILSSEKRPFGFQARSFDPRSRVKYITQFLDSSVPRFYGLDRVDLSRKTYYFEGPLDSEFVDNSLASCGGLITKDLGLLGQPTELVVVCYDNEPRSRETVKKMRAAIDSGLAVCVWPSSEREKDVNSMVSQRVERGEPLERAMSSVKHVIDASTSRGLEASLALDSWRKTT